VVPENPRTLVIGPGGGSDVLVALAAGSETVTAAEMNPLMLRFVRHFGARAGNLYDHPKVEAVLTEGRTFIRRTDRLFDVILLGYVDSWAAVASGGLSLSENHLYTTEAFRAYYDHLTPGGALVILRWHVDVPRLVSNAIAVLGREEARKRIAVVFEKRGTDRDPSQMIFMLKRRPFTEEETARMAGWTLAVPAIVPDRHVDEPYASVFDGRMSVGEWEETAPTRVDPVTDDRPFFFARQKPWGLPPSMRREFVRIVIPLLVLCVVLVALGRPRAQPARPYLASVCYFSCLGVAFIAVELGLLQQLTLLLGHPIFTLSILLFTLLASGGLGSYWSGQFRPGRACLAASGLGVLYAVVLPRAASALMPLPLGGRIVIAIALVAPLGFVMGMPFPRGLMAVGRGPFPGAPFYWGLNGIFSVVGSLATMVAAVTMGFQVAMIAGALVYVGAAASATVLETPRVTREEAAA
jgi:SAM-dependent methyltransferase